MRNRHLASSALVCLHAGAAAQLGQAVKLHSLQLDIREPAGHVHRQRAQSEGLSATKGSRVCPKGQSRGMAASRGAPVAASHEAPVAASRGEPGAALEFSWLREAAARGFVLFVLLLLLLLR